MAGRVSRSARFEDRFRDRFQDRFQEGFRHRFQHRFRGALGVALAVVVLLLGIGAEGSTARWPSAALAQETSCDPSWLVADWPARDLLPQSETPASAWYERNWNGGWGPRPVSYPAVAAPAGCDPVQWQRARVLAVARRYLGLSYRHHHLPGWDPPAVLTGPTNAGAGIDCSNFSAWVYNYGLGIRFTSNVQQQADGPLAPGRVLAPNEPFAPVDLLYILRQNRADVSHVVIYVDDDVVIDSHGAFGGITEHPREGWYLTHYSHARRIIEGRVAAPVDDLDQPGKDPAG